MPEMTDKCEIRFNPEQYCKTLRIGRVKTRRYQRVKIQSSDYLSRCGLTVMLNHASVYIFLEAVALAISEFTGKDLIKSCRNVLKQ